MARKKKTTESQVSEEEVKQETKNAITYKGSVKVQLIKNGKVLKTHKLHNNGRYPVFQFLCECLRGNYVNADVERPKYISLFTVDSDTYSKYLKGNSTISISSLFNADNRASIGAATFKGTPKLEVTQSTETDLNGSANLVYEFSIPSQNITDVNANAVCIYGTENWNSSFDNPSAYFFCTDDDGGLTKLIDRSIDNNYSILVEWTMTFKN